MLWPEPIWWEFADAPHGSCLLLLTRRGSKQRRFSSWQDDQRFGSYVPATLTTNSASFWTVYRSFAHVILHCLPKPETARALKLLLLETGAAAGTSWPLLHLRAAQTLCNR